jgi:uncharacterized integral membrane protein (TIGR00698 family)
LRDKFFLSAIHFKFWLFTAFGRTIVVMRTPFTAQNIFFVCILLGATGLVSPPFALAGGLAFAFLVHHPYPTESRQLSHFLLQASVILLGFSMNLGQVLAAGRSGLVYSAIGISLTLWLGLLLGRLFKVERVSSTLIAAGTAICGGSAIAALGPVLEAGEEALAVSLGAVFVLNSVALFLFPALGHHFGLSQTQFGTWAALAIHDTSSVVGASEHYGAGALAIAVPVKLVRALWIVPVSLLYATLITSRAGSGTATETGTRAKAHLPWFLAWFLLAATVATFLPKMLPSLQATLHSDFGAFAKLGKSGLAVTLFLIGSSLNRRALSRVGFQPLLQAVLLWIVSASASLLAIEKGWITP